MDGMGSWLCPTERDRERLVEHNGRATKTRLISSGSIAVALLASVPWLGMAPLIFLIVSSVNLTIVDVLMTRVKRPEWVSAVAVLTTQLIIGGAIATTGGPHSPL